MSIAKEKEFPGLYDPDIAREYTTRIIRNWKVGTYFDGEILTEWVGAESVHGALVAGYIRNNVMRDAKSVKRLLLPALGAELK